MPKVIFDKKLTTAKDIKDFKVEGSAGISFGGGAMRVTVLPIEKPAPETGHGDKTCDNSSAVMGISDIPGEPREPSCAVLWCPKACPADVRIDWEFRPIKGPGEAILFFAARPRVGAGTIFDPGITAREGLMSEYYEGDINSFQLTYYKRKSKKDREVHISELFKNTGINLVSRGADPFPCAKEDSPWYRMTLIKRNSDVIFYVNDLGILSYHDDGMTYGDILTGGHLGFTHTGDLTAEYRNLVVTWI